MQVIGTTQVSNAHVFAKCTQPLALAVVQHPNGFAGIVNRVRTDDGFLKDVQRLVVGWDEDVHVRQWTGHAVAIGLITSGVGPTHDQQKDHDFDEGQNLHTPHPPYPRLRPATVVVFDPNRARQSPTQVLQPYQDRQQAHHFSELERGSIRTPHPQKKTNHKQQRDEFHVAITS